MIWEFQDPKMEGAYHISGHSFVGEIPLALKIGLRYGKYLQFSFLKWLLSKCQTN